MSEQDSTRTAQFEAVKQGAAFGFVAVGMLAAGYVVGFLHGASAYERSAPMFMAGVALTAFFAVGLVAIGRKRVREGLDG